MAIPLNEEIREEARKMSEFVIEDTKRTVELLNWVKDKNMSESKSVLGDAIKAGASIFTGNILEGAKIIDSAILPRLRERITELKQEEVIPIPNTELMDKLKLINVHVHEIRLLLTEPPIDANAIDDHAFEAQQLIFELSKLV